MTPTEGQTTTEAAVGCDYSGHEFGASYPDSYCVGGFLHDADSDYLNDESIPCPMCDREGAIEYRAAGGSDEDLANATALVDDIRFNRGIPLPTTGAKTP